MLYPNPKERYTIGIDELKGNVKDTFYRIYDKQQMFYIVQIHNSIKDAKNIRDTILSGLIN